MGREEEVRGEQDVNSATEVNKSQFYGHFQPEFLLLETTRLQIAKELLSLVWSLFILCTGIAL